MSRWRILVVLALLSTPVAVWAVVGSIYLWRNGWAFWVWWPLMGMVALGYGLAWYWQRKRQLLRPPDFEPQRHWTDRDRGAWQLVKARAEAAPQVPVEQLGQPAHYLQVSQEMARQLAEYYHPGAHDPIENVTVPELLAVIELAAGDMWEIVESGLPAGHLLTIRDWKRAQQAVNVYQQGNKVYWAIAGVFNPVQTAARFAAAQFGLGSLMTLLQQNLFLWFYVRFLERLGTYLIDLNSGRLRVGARRYRELVQQMDRRAEAVDTALEAGVAGPFRQEQGQAVSDAAEQVRSVGVTLMGQVKAGKSSLVNALLGEQRARVGVVPTTDGVDRYELVSPGVPTQLTLYDTVGYAQAGPRVDQVKTTAEAARQSDLLLLVLHARNPGRKADVEMLDQLRAWFAERPALKMPPVIAVLTHIDLLSPSMEWQPPYDLLHGTRPKEVNIRDAVAATWQQLGERVVSVVPVSSAADSVYGIQEYLLPSVTNWLDEAHGVALMRTLMAEADRDRVRRLFRQLKETGLTLFQALKEQLLQGRTGAHP